MAKRLFVDLDLCSECEECAVKCRCSYPFHPQNNGIIYLREWLHFQLVCRKCEDAPCLNACRYEALERPENGIIKRNNFLCVGCKSCALACPFGTIYFEIISFLTFNCDLCEGRLEEKEIPLCSRTCPKEAIKYGDFEADPGKNRHILNNVVVQVTPWKKV
ncbi:MAG: 4Fe-4S dicluster domain-containing protein [bacterium]